LLTREAPVMRAASAQPGREDVPLNFYRVRSPGIARVLASTRLTPLGCDDVRHIVLDLSGLGFRYVEGQSLGILAPGLDERGLAPKLRLYSIASSRQGDDGLGNTASLCVKRVVYSEPVTGREHRGIVSNYLCDLKPGDAVAITGPSGKALLLPDDARANLVLVATGTGIAPFRAFLHRIYRERDDWSGKVLLFFGVRSEAECLYRDELDAFQSRHGFECEYAFSREQATAGGLRMYVQHRMAERIEALRALLASDRTYLYLCGLKGLEAGVAAVLDASGEAGGPGVSMFDGLKRSGRLSIEVY
jgi:ferredoxin--NADP+ reductase